MASMSINGVPQGTYKYDFAGRQAIRTIASTGITIHSVFDSQGRRIAEYNQATGALIREYVWLNWEPIAVIEGGVTYLVRTDHIGRPVFATNTAATKVWTATYDPFGGVRTTTGTPINARFPGQWFQSESGLHQNWMRDYDPTTGRYLQADPLGLVDGASVYGYALQSPIMNVDPRGEQSIIRNGPQSLGVPMFPGETRPGQLGESMLDLLKLLDPRPALEACIYILDPATHGILYSKGYPPGYLPGDQGAIEWGARNGIPPREAKNRFHDLKGAIGAGAKENMGVNPETGDVVDGNGEPAGNLFDED
jgi:RHS repeat-associated protein